MSTPRSLRNSGRYAVAFGLSSLGFAVGIGLPAVATLDLAFRSDTSASLPRIATLPINLSLGLATLGLLSLGRALRRSGRASREL